MPLTDEQAKTIKEQIIKQIESSFPSDKKDSAISYVKSLDNEKLEEFIIKNKLIKSEDSENPSDNKPSKPLSTGKPGSSCIYCMLGNKQIDSLPIYEDEDYISVLEINPFTKGHVTLIPKKHIKETKALKSKAFSLAKKIGNHITKNLKAENFQVNSSDELGHAIINIIPTYKGEPLSFERRKASPEELKDIAMTIGKLEKKQPIKKEKKNPEEKNQKEEKRPQEQKSKLPQYPRRIP